jgi:hypothetical protein
MFTVASRDIFDKENIENLMIFSKKIKKDDKNKENTLLRAPMNNIMK